jgi:hypothetical protein
MTRDPHQRPIAGVSDGSATDQRRMSLCRVIQQSPDFPGRFWCRLSTSDRCDAFSRDTHMCARTRAQVRSIGKSVASVAPVAMGSFPCWQSLVIPVVAASAGYSGTSHAAEHCFDQLWVCATIRGAWHARDGITPILAFPCHRGTISDIAVQHPS